MNTRCTNSSWLKGGLVLVVKRSFRVERHGKADDVGRRKRVYKSRDGTAPVFQ
jgi:hypothetical protein